MPRDALMAVYLVRQTEEEECLGCGACEDICPVEAVKIVEDKAQVDVDWCIGCGVCAVVCPTEAITLVRRWDKSPPEDFATLIGELVKEKQDQ